MNFFNFADSATHFFWSTTSTARGGALWAPGGGFCWLEINFDSLELVQFVLRSPKNVEMCLWREQNNVSAKSWSQIQGAKLPVFVLKSGLFQFTWMAIALQSCTFLQG